MPKTEQYQRLIEQFLQTLQELPDVHVSLQPQYELHIKTGIRADALVDIRVGRKTFALLVEARKRVYPSDVSQVICQIKKCEEEFSEQNKEQRDIIPIVVSESLFQGAKEMLREEGVGYYDTSGSLFLSAQDVYLYIDKPPTKTIEKSIRMLYSGRRSQVLHALLTCPKEWMGVKELAERAQVSTATVSQVLTALDRFDWIATRGQGPNKERLLVEPSSLLDAWSKHVQSLGAPLLRRYYVPSAGTEKLLGLIGKVFEEHRVEYAVTHEAAAQRYAPFLTSVSQVRCRVLAGHVAETAIGILNARVVNEGANLAVIEGKSHGDFLFREQHDDIWLASPVQVYLDLLRGEGRSKEMAEHLRKEKIGF